VGYKNISAIKAHMQIAYFKCYKISFYGAVDFFDISEDASRSKSLGAQLVYQFGYKGVQYF
jgi:hypothetical protein